MEQREEKLESFNSDTLEGLVSAMGQLADLVFAPQSFFQDSPDPDLLSYESFSAILGNECDSFLTLVGRDQLNIIIGNKELGYRFFHPLVQDHVAVHHVSEKLQNTGNQNYIKEALLALISVSDHGFEDRVRPLLDDDDPGKRTTAALGLAVMGDKEIAEPLIKGLDPSNPKVALFSMYGLFVLSERDAIHQARNQLKRLMTYDGRIGDSIDEDEKIRFLSGVLLAWVLDLGTVAELGFRLLTTSDEEMQNAIVVSLAISALYYGIGAFSEDLLGKAEGWVAKLIKDHGANMIARGRSLPSINQRRLGSGS